MKLYHVVAMARNRVIGKDNKLPWHFPSDLKHFKQLTSGNTVIMGRKTYESIGRPLPNRENFVLSRKPVHDQANPRFFSSIDAAFDSVKTAQAFIIGGGELYRETLSRIDGIYLTQIDADYEGDTFYPEIPADFTERSRTVLQDHPRVEVIYYERRRSSECER